MIRVMSSELYLLLLALGVAASILIPGRGMPGIAVAIFVIVYLIFWTFHVVDTRRFREALIQLAIGAGGVLVILAGWLITGLVRGSVGWGS